MTLSAGNASFKIPPGDPPNSAMNSYYTVPAD